MNEIVTDSNLNLLYSNNGPKYINSTNFCGFCLENSAPSLARIELHLRNYYTRKCNKETIETDFTFGDSISGNAFLHCARFSSSNASKLHSGHIRSLASCGQHYFRKRDAVKWRVLASIWKSGNSSISYSQPFFSSTIVSKFPPNQQLCLLSWEPTKKICARECLFVTAPNVDRPQKYIPLVLQMLARFATQAFC